MISKIPPDLLRDVRFQVETKFRLSLYKQVEYPFLPSVGVKDIFHSFQHHELGFLGVLHLHWQLVEDTSFAYQTLWYDDIHEAISVAQQLQSKKIANEDKIMTYVSHYFNNIYNKTKQESGIILLN